jgi:hypothetical protein
MPKDVPMSRGVGRIATTGAVVWEVLREGIVCGHCGRSLEAGETYVRKRVNERPEPLCSSCSHLSSADVVRPYPARARAAQREEHALEWLSAGARRSAIRLLALLEDQAKRGVRFVNLDDAAKALLLPLPQMRRLVDALAQRDLIVIVQTWETPFYPLTEIGLAQTGVRGASDMPVAAKALGGRPHIGEG